MVLDYFDSSGNPIPVPTSEIKMSGVEGYITYRDNDHPEKGVITIPLDTFPQIKAYMDYLTASNRFKHVRWFPTSLPSSPPKEG